MNSSTTVTGPGVSAGQRPIDIIRAGMKKRRAREKRFQWVSLAAIILGISFVAMLFISIFLSGYTAFFQTYLKIDVALDPAVIAPDGQMDRETLGRADFGGLIKQSLREDFPDVTSRAEKRKLYDLVSSGAAFQLRDRVMEDPSLVGQTISLWVPADDEIDMLNKGHIDRALPESERRIKDNQLAWVDQLAEEGRLTTRFNTTFFTAGDSRDPELAGIWGAAAGSFFTLTVTLLLSFPLGVAAAVYLEEFAPRNRITDLIEVNINNLAAVPSIVFGLLGLAVFINFFGLPRSAPLVGGLVLTLMTLPTIIIASRAALKAVPPSIREAALGIGASPLQTVTYHVLPLAMPGMLTGTIIGMAQALGETAPLLMIGMVAFIVDVPSNAFDPSTALPVQIFLWADSPERAFVERTSGAILVLLVFLALMNFAAVLMRRRFERRW
ncbi:MAG: phosphate ABC transporter permease PstA [Pseudomonadota bacterium]|nr:phosphate ABC transporter permease PstA [Pseudomonadota bacterium]